MKRILYTLVGFWLVTLGGCRKQYDAAVPYTFANEPGSGAFTASIRQAMEGVYTVSNGAESFSSQVVLKWTYLHSGTDTTHYLSIFTSANATYFSLEVDPKTDSLVVSGYWRRLVNADIGLVRFTVQTTNKGKLRSYGGRLTEGDTLVLNGFYGDKNEALGRPLKLTYKRPLNPRPYAILAHRGGGRTSDLLPASENSIDMIKLASRLGATGVELDVRYTKDGVPILYHDNTLNLRLIRKNGLTGPVEQYTYQQLNALVTLVNGEKIPTLEEALETVINQTSLSFVWLDTKYIGPMDKVQAIQQRYRQKAIQARRNLQIVIGLPTTDALDAYKALANKENTPILSELDTAITRNIGARIWAPRWTLGTQTAEVQAMKAQGRTVFVWTLDEPSFIEEFVNQSKFDGILSNYSPVVAYYHYIEQ